MSLNGFLLAAAGGAIGSAARYGVSIASMRLLGANWPWGTFSVNIIGSLAMGFLIGWLTARGVGGQAIRLFFATGILGGFTTFSAFSLETVLMIEKKAYLSATGYVSASIALGVGALIAGLALSRSLFA